MDRLFVTLLLLLVVIHIGAMGLRIGRAVLAGKRANKATRPYERFLKHATSHIAVLGDSTMYGAGIKNRAYTIGGLLSEKFPKSSVETLAYNGAKVKDLATQLKCANEKHYTVMMIGIGGNDIVGLTSLAEMDTSVRQFFEVAQAKADILIIFHCVNLGNIGFFLFPLNYFFAYRTRRVSDLFKRLALDSQNVRYVNFYRSKSDDFYTSKTRKKFIADDSFHPSDYANQFFFNLIWQSVPELKALAKSTR